jgi:MtN3 and saliva related transmembrane protein
VAREKKAADISLWMLAVLFTGLSLWTCYGIMKEDWIITISNAFSLLVNLAIGVLAVRYRNRG